MADTTDQLIDRNWQLLAVDRDGARDRLSRNWHQRPLPALETGGHYDR